MMKFTPPTCAPKGAQSDLTYAKKTLVALATLSALGMASGLVFAWNNITHYPVDSNWELTVKGPDCPDRKSVV